MTLLRSGEASFYINKTGALMIANITNGAFGAPLGTADHYSTGNISQTGPVVVDTLTAKTLNNAGASIILTNAGNDVNQPQFAFARCSGYHKQHRAAYLL